MTTPQVIVGLAGFGRSGKDELAKQLVANEGFKRVAFADAMRNILYALNPIIEANNMNIEQNGSNAFVEIRVSEIVDAIGWERAKVEYEEIRQLLQRLGTDGARAHLSDDIWVRTVLENNSEVPRLVIPDVRFPNEAEELKKRGGVIIRVIREGYGAVNGHISETAYTDQDIILHNDGTPDDLYRNYVEAIQEWSGNNQ
jgi:dephospho-CoA kinase